MPIIDVYGERRAEEARNDTWGHLAPDPERDYEGTIVFAHSAYGGDLVLVEVNFGDLPDSPWLFEGLTDFLSDQQDTDPGAVYRFTGTYRWEDRRHHRFSGRVSAIPLPA